MSLLLDALKKAEAAKRRRLEAGVEQSEPATAAAADTSPTPESQQPISAIPPLTTDTQLPELLTLDDHSELPATADPTPIAPLAMAPVALSTLSFSEESAPTQSPADSTLVEPVIADPAIVESPVRPTVIEFSPTAAINLPTAPSETAAPNAAAPVETPIPALETIKPTPREKPAAAALSPEATRQLFDSKSKANKGREESRRRLFLLGCLALCTAGAVGGWFWWQAQQNGTSLTPALANIPAVATPPSNAPSTTLTASPIEAAATTIPATPATNAAPSAATSQNSVPTTSLPPKVEAAAPSTPKVSLVTTPAATIPTQPKPGDRAKVIEMPSRAFAPEVRFVRDDVPQTVPKNISLAYQAFQQGDLNRAAELYRQHLASDSKSRDALLGLAAIATRRHQSDEARNLYRRLLADNPGDELASGALLMLSSDSDTESAENRLQTLFDQRPSAEVATSLGNIFAKQGRWREAQDVYFKAHSLAPNEPDYAYNLAVALDALGERKLAGEFYNKALNLSQSKPANFDVAGVRKRLAALGAN